MSTLATVGSRPPGRGAPRPGPAGPVGGGADAHLVKTGGRAIAVVCGSCSGRSGGGTNEDARFVNTDGRTIAVVLGSRSGRSLGGTNVEARWRVLDRLRRSITC